MYGRILCAHDLSADSMPALRAALDLGRELKGTVHVLHVVMEPLPVPPGLWFAPDFDVEFIDQRMRLVATQELERLLREAAHPGDPPTHIDVQVGVPGETIVARAKEIDAALIVMGTHGRKGWQHLMLGSVAERVVRTAPVPVLTVSPTAARVLEGFKEDVTAAR